MYMCTSKFCGVLSSDIASANYNREKNTMAGHTCEPETPSVIRGVRKKPSPSQDHGVGDQSMENTKRERLCCLIPHK
ncbi:hypothetical protein TNCV_3809831 [Trichonephila clavipes]|nr:hypothetical protein TNCV_3809831 [Trichonephila clavipes]